MSFKFNIYPNNGPEYVCLARNAVRDRYEASDAKQTSFDHYFSSLMESKSNCIEFGSAGLWPTCFERLGSLLKETLNHGIT